ERLALEWRLALPGEQQVGAIEPDRVVPDAGRADHLVQARKRVQMAPDVGLDAGRVGLQPETEGDARHAQSSRKISGSSIRPSVATSSANSGAIAAFQRVVTSADAWCALAAAGSSHS